MKIKKLFNKHGDSFIASILTVCAFITIILGFTACGSTVSGDVSGKTVSDEQAMEELWNENQMLKEELEAYRQVNSDEHSDVTYLVTLKIKQVHYTLDVSEHIKDSLNDIEITIPVDREFYESIDKGDTLDDSFRWGSLLAKGSLGKWKITVKDKTIQLNEN